MDCPICLNVINKSVMGPCSHHFCSGCLLKWCEFGGTQCPICKTLLTEIKYDREFDNLISIIKQDNTENSEIIDNYLPKDINITVSFPKDRSHGWWRKRKCKTGITIENNYQSPGVVISKINSKYECYKSGLREKDIIIFINNIPCINHEQTIKIIDEICNNNGIMHCTLLRIKEK